MTPRPLLSPALMVFCLACSDGASRSSSESAAGTRTQSPTVPPENTAATPAPTGTGSAERASAEGLGGALRVDPSTANFGATPAAAKPPPSDDGASSAAPVSAPGREAINHIFLLLGQSNMAGYAKARDSDRVEDPRVTVLGFDDCAATGRAADQWDIAAPPLHECWNGAVGPGDWFAKTLLERLPDGDTIALVPGALSGQAVEVFMKGEGTRYDWIVQRAEAALAMGGAIDGILFHQGESNCGNPAWPAQVKTLVSDLRADLGLADVPFLAGELPYDGNCATHNALVAELPGLIPNAYVVSAEGLAVDPADTRWNLHFGHDETVELGRRYAETLMAARGM